MSPSKLQVGDGLGTHFKGSLERIYGLYTPTRKGRDKIKTKEYKSEAYLFIFFQMDIAYTLVVYDLLICAEGHIMTNTPPKSHIAGQLYHTPDVTCHAYIT